MPIEIDLEDLALILEGIAEDAGQAWKLSTALDQAGDEVGADLWGTVAVNFEGLAEAYADVLLHHSGVTPEDAGEA